MEADQPESKSMSVREAGRRGGETTKSRLGLDHFRKIGIKGGKKTASLYKQLLRDFGRRGGRPRLPNLF